MLYLLILVLTSASLLTSGNLVSQKDQYSSGFAGQLFQEEISNLQQKIASQGQRIQQLENDNIGCTSKLNILSWKLENIDKKITKLEEKHHQDIVAINTNCQCSGNQFQPQNGNFNALSPSVEATTEAGISGSLDYLQIEEDGGDSSSLDSSSGWTKHVNGSYNYIKESSSSSSSSSLGAGEENHVSNNNPREQWFVQKQNRVSNDNARGYGAVKEQNRVSNDNAGGQWVWSDMANKWEWKQFSGHLIKSLPEFPALDNDNLGAPQQQQQQHQHQRQRQQHQHQQQQQNSDLGSMIGDSDCCWSQLPNSTWVKKSSSWFRNSSRSSSRKGLNGASVVQHGGLNGAQHGGLNGANLVQPGSGSTDTGWKQLPDGSYRRQWSSWSSWSSGKP